MNDLIVKANDVINASYYLSLIEQRLVLAAISKINHDDAYYYNKRYYIEKKDFVNLGADPKNAVREIREACNNLYERSITIRTNSVIYKARWISSIMVINANGDNDDKYNSDGNAVAVIKFNDEIMPYLSNLTSNFTQYKMSDISSFTSIYSIRIYEMCMQFRSTGYRKIYIDDLRDMLYLEDKYPLFADLKKRVIEPALKDINTGTLFSIECDYIKRGKKIDFIILNFKENTKPNTKTSKEDSAERDSSCGDLFTIDGLSDAQLARIANNPLFIAHYNHLLDPMNPANQNPKLWTGEMVKRLKANLVPFDRQPLRDYLDY